MKSVRTRASLQTCFFALLASLAGCARVATTTTLNSDGSFSRKVVYTVAKNTFGPPASSAPGVQKREKPEDYYRIPAPGAGIKVAHADDDKSYITTVTRDSAAGSAPVEDIALLGDKGKVSATSSVTVRKLPNGDLEYIETLHNPSPSSTAERMIDPTLRARVKKALPAEYQTTALIDRLTNEVMGNVLRVAFGPPEPNLLSFMLSPEAAARKIDSIAFVANKKSFLAAIPALTEMQATAIARSLGKAFLQDSLDPTSQATAQTGSNSSSSFGAEIAPLFFSVSFPGKVVETDGIFDPVEGDVYWSLLPIALEIGDVKLRLVVRP